MLSLNDYYFKLKGTQASGGTQVNGTIAINENGLHDVSSYKFANVEVPVPSDYVKPSGTLDITENGLYNVREYENVNVEGGNTLKKLLDNTKTGENLFKNYSGDNLSDLIKYNDTENVTNFNNMYNNCSSATSFPQIDTSNGTNFSYMYRYCKKATSFPQIDTSNGTNFNNMYGDCSSATSFPQIDTSNGTNFSYMYNNCSSATSFPQIDTSNGTSFERIFGSCSSAINIPPLNTSKCTNFNSMFYYLGRIKKAEVSHYGATSNSTNVWGGCCSLKAIIIRSFGNNFVLGGSSFYNCYHILGITSTIYNPNGDKDGYIYVPRDMIETLSSATNWSTVATQFRALEDYTKDGTTTGEFDDEKAGLV